MQKELKKLAVSIVRNVSCMGFRNAAGHAMTFRQGLDVVAKLGGMKAWQTVAAMKPVKGALTPDGKPGEFHRDYVLEDSESVWISVKGHSICIIPTDDGVIVDVYAKGAENGGTTASTYAFDTDAEATYCEDNEIDLDDVAEWVGLHHMKNFDTESPVQRMDWLHRYVEAHGIGGAESELDDTTKSILDELPIAKHCDQWELEKDEDVDDLFKLTVNIDDVGYPTALGFSSEAEYKKAEPQLRDYYHSRVRAASQDEDEMQEPGWYVISSYDGKALSGPYESEGDAQAEIDSDPEQAGGVVHLVE